MQACIYRVARVCTVDTGFNVEHDGVSIEYWKIEVAVFLPLPHPNNKTCVDSTKVELYSYTHAAGAFLVWLVAAGAFFI